MTVDRPPTHAKSRWTAAERHGPPPNAVTGGSGGQLPTEFTYDRDQRHPLPPGRAGGGGGAARPRTHWVRRGPAGKANQMGQDNRTPPTCVTFRCVVVSLRGPGQSPGLPFACCVGSLRSVGRCDRCSCWCRFRVRGAQSLVCWGCAGCGGMCRLHVSGPPCPANNRVLKNYGPNRSCRWRNHSHCISFVVHRDMLRTFEMKSYKSSVTRASRSTLG